ncbi:hypothetical protein BMH32_06980 [Leucobacter sp. OLJS4]|uniref:hypothetical protein n=1 Tax=unclassified Leucobacter TaxID=2621730 RepID=UPI000C177239|nr:MULTISPECIES: hypothetical protein [unclassified Leucobacter]PII82510.1 hypothetical protein BMH25_11705 [Leucobacter sp. OLCALW19]PII87307.1 hypothetical protein BMH26_09090 [Leucobacter sp. OLTLW20]PII94637.1 hypothetical protein BMH27_01310 [Leucobacter sp. OLAS13]PII97833.1 hypothetical protein BMH28_13585 [Leucobacter sp. OLCS4]PIJ00565.1 hypothetical protein BMH29_00205 [Leucobacter sp. OLDS2]
MTWEQPPLPPEYREQLSRGRKARWNGSWEPPRDATEGRLRRGAAAAWMVGLPYAVLAICWIGALVNVDNWAGLGWLAGMWLACLLLFPSALLGAIWAGMVRRWGAMWWGIVAAVLCLPGFVLGFSVLFSMIL